MTKRRATALPNPELVDRLCEQVLAKLGDRLEQQLSSKQWVVRSSRTRDAIEARQGNCL